MNHNDTAKKILYESVLLVAPGAIEAFRHAAKGGIPLREVKAIIRLKASKKQLETGVMPGALLAAAEVVYEQEKKEKP